jgi:tetratricopeptide (TPR) repeat protein
LNAKEALTHNERGAALSYLNRFDEAIKEYSKALELDRQLARAYRNRGSAYFHQGEALEKKGTEQGAKDEFKKAVDDCTKAIAIDPRYMAAYQTRGRAYAKLGEAALAKKDQDSVDVLSGSIPDR